MFLEKTSQEVKGYVEITVFGFFIERFLNLVLNSNINIWDIKKIDDATAAFKTDAFGYKKLSPIASKTGCKLTINKKKGIPFFIIRHKKRPTFPILFIVIAICIYFYNLHVWHINIIGDFTFPIEEIRQELENEGIKIGVRKNDLDTNYIKNNIYMHRHDIAFIGINFKGTECTIEIIEANLKPKENELDKVPCNIVADKDGVICKMNVLEGMPLVSSGDMVKSGDILISGIITKESLPTRLVNSKGEVYIKTWHTHKETVQLERDIVSHTGNVQNKYGLEIQNYKINFGNSSTKFEKYDTMVSKNNLNLLGMLELPVVLEQIKYREIDIETVKYTKSQAINLAVRTIENKMAKEVNGMEIVNKDIKTVEGEDNITVVVTIECIEKVGVKKKLEG